MFGFAIWDGPRKRLLLARDKAGKKPLYYTRLNGTVIFGSEIKAILGHPQVKREVDIQAMADFLSVRYVPAPATLFKDIVKVKPGHWLLFEGETLVKSAIGISSFGKVEKHSIPDYLAGIKQHVQRAVEERMMADVPAWCHEWRRRLQYHYRHHEPTHQP